MAVIERYREWYEHERDSNDKMIGMLEGVPADRRDDARYARALTLAGHLAACRENWLDMIRHGETDLVDWWPQDVKLAELRPRYGRLESAWTEYLGSLTDEELVKDFEFKDGGHWWRWNVEGQVAQLNGHAPYHRGQIAQIVDSLGGETVATDYVDWAMPRDPRWGGPIERQTA
jgi:uncharacterized damage-inducible protein DinB